jgi:hypothetical protein
VGWGRSAGWLCRFDVTAALDWEDGGKVSDLPGWPGVLYFFHFFFVCPFERRLVPSLA